MDRSQTAAVQRMTATPAGPVATVGRPAGQRRARPQGLSYTDWGATGEPRNRYSTRGERFPEKPLGRRPPPSFHPTHTHARTPHARSAIRQQTPRPGRHSGTPQGGTEQDARLRVLPAPPPVHAQHCRRGPRPSAQPLLSGGCVPPPAARREGLGKKGTWADGHRGCSAGLSVPVLDIAGVPARPAASNRPHTETLLPTVPQVTQLWASTTGPHGAPVGEGDEP